MSILNDLGIDPDHLEWHQLSLCNGMNLSWFYDLYESDSEVAKQVDNICLACPVTRECGTAGSAGEYGVWGGIYWAGNGKQDRAKNSHKSEGVWDMIKEKYL